MRYVWYVWYVSYCFGEVEGFTTHTAAELARARSFHIRLSEIGKLQFYFLPNSTLAVREGFQHVLSPTSDQQRARFEKFLHGLERNLQVIGIWLSRARWSSVTHVRRWQQIDSLSTLFKFVEKFAWMDAFLLPPSRRRAANIKTTLNRNGKNSNNVNEGWLTDETGQLFCLHFSLRCRLWCCEFSSPAQRRLRQSSRHVVVVGCLSLAKRRELKFQELSGEFTIFIFAIVISWLLDGLAAVLCWLS